jgi:hypothetical protein
VLCSLLPLAIDAILIPIHHASSWRAYVWMAIGAALTTAMLITSPWAWRRVCELADPIDRMLEGSGAPHEEYVETVRRRLGLGWSHYLLCGAGAAVGLFGAYMSSRSLPRGTIGGGYYVDSAMLGFFGADSVRWMLRIPLILVWPLTGIRSLRVVMHSPTTTPAIREMAQLSAETALRAGLGLFLLGIPLLWVILAAKTGDTHVLVELALAPLAASAGVVLYVSFVPQLWLAQIVGTQRDRLLDELARELPEQGAANLLSPNTEKAMNLYDQIAATSTETAEARAVAKRAVGALTVLLPQLIAVGGWLVDKKL